MWTDLYERDFHQWTERSAELLREGRLSEIDAENIAEELESMGRSQKRELNSRLTVLSAHLLKWEHEPNFRSKSWTKAIRSQRNEIEDLLEDSPSLAGKVDLTKAYRRAAEEAASDMGVDARLFPPSCPYSFDQAKDGGFWPGS